MKRINYLTMILFMAMMVVSCKEDEQMDPVNSFTVTIQNDFESKDFFNSGMLVAIPPGANYSFSFHAGKGHYLSFATMFAQSNDLFYAPDESGIALYDDSGHPITGDVTDQIQLWDAGTEVNQEPGLGADQAPRQSAPDTGMDENGTVKLLMNIDDGFNYPQVGAVINMTLSHDGHSMFTVNISNVSEAGDLQTPLAPGVWVVHGNDHPIFSAGNQASAGLEDLAEDGINSTLKDDYDMKSGYVSPFAPGIWAVYRNSDPISSMGMQATSELEALAEDGDPTGFVNILSSDEDIRSFNVFNMPVGSGNTAPIFPNESYSFVFEGSAGDKLSLATMLVQSNDLFVWGEIDLFPNGNPVSGDITGQLKLLDARTEVNEFPGAGNYQAPRQPGPNSGMEENGLVGEVNDAFDYPNITDMIKVTISASN